MLGYKKDALKEGKYTDSSCNVNKVSAKKKSKRLFATEKRMDMVTGH